MHWNWGRWSSCDQSFVMSPRRLHNHCVSLLWFLASVEGTVQELLPWKHCHWWVEHHWLHLIGRYSVYFEQGQIATGLARHCCLLLLSNPWQSALQPFAHLQNTGLEQGAASSLAFSLLWRASCVVVVVVVMRGASCHQSCENVSAMSRLLFCVAAKYESSV